MELKMGRKVRFLAVAVLQLLNAKITVDATLVN
jgi:hypothetical protein